MGNQNLDLKKKLSPYIDLKYGRRCRSVNKCSIGDDVWCLHANINNAYEIIAYIESNPHTLENIPSLKNIHNMKLCPLIAEVQGISRGWIEAAKVTKPPIPNEIVRFADPQNEIEIRPLQLKAHHGAAWRLKDCWVIHINKNEALSQQRMTIIHEGFHILLHKIFEPEHRGQIISTGILNEMIANAFAAFVLIPEELVRNEWDKHKDIESLAKSFEVSHQAIYLRLIQLGIISPFNGKLIQEDLKVSRPRLN